jgi:hypothetical protein
LLFARHARHCRPSPSRIGAIRGSALCELWRSEMVEPVETLRRAQVWVRDSTNREKRERLADVAELAGASHPSARRFWQDAHRDTQPDRWAEFCYVGA